MKFRWVLCFVIVGCIGPPPAIPTATDSQTADLGHSDVPADARTSTDATVPSADSPRDLAPLADFGFDALIPPDLAPDIGIDMARACPPLSPVARWSMDVRRGDFIINEYNAGQPPLQLSGSSLSAGKFGLALERDGSLTQLPSIVHEPILAPERGSISLWIQPAPAALGLGVEVGIFSKDAKDTMVAGHTLIKLRNSRVRFRQQGLTTEVILEAPTPLNVGEWTHIVGTWRFGGLELYVNGVLVDSSDTGWSTIENKEPVGIGFSTWASEDFSVLPASDPFTGRIDEINVFDIVIDQTAVEALGRGCGALP